VSKRRDDGDIEGRFHALRAETEGSGRVPDFQAMMERARQDAERATTLQVMDGGAPAKGTRLPRRRVLWIGGGASAALAAALAGLLLTRGGPSPDEEFERLVASFAAEAPAAWRSPTDRLLDVPGMEFIRTVPSVGRGLPGPESGDRPEGERSKGREGRS